VQNLKVDNVSYEVEINWNIKRPVKTDYKNWDEYWLALCNYLLEKYKNTYCRKK